MILALLILAASRRFEIYEPSKCPSCYKNLPVAPMVEHPTGVRRAEGHGKLHPQWLVESLFYLFYPPLQVLKDFAVRDGIPLC